MQFLDEVSRIEAENVAAFSHAGVLKTMLDCVFNMKLPRRAIQCANCTIAVFEYKDAWQLQSWINPKELV